MAQSRVIRVALYARFSDAERQEARSIPDQLRVCRLGLPRFFPGERVEEVGVYCDAGISGQHTAKRPEARRLLADARAGKMDAIVAEDLDRLHRNLEHSAGFFSRATDAGVRIFTLADGLVTEMTVAFKGLKAQLDSKVLGEKVYRGLSGRAAEGKNAGGRAYGYKLERSIDAKGELVRGQLAIDPTTSPVVLRIYAEYLAGASAKKIAQALNRDGIPSPRGGEWSQSTINGQHGRATGILNNPIYVGTVTYGRMKFSKDPDTGNRRARHRPKSDHVTAERPDLAIVDRATWDKVQTKRAEYASRPFFRARRPKHLFSGLVTCGVCGASYTVNGADKLRCSAHASGKRCDNGRIIRVHELAERVLTNIKKHLVAPRRLKLMLETFRTEMRLLSAEAARDQGTAEHRLQQIARQLTNMADAIAERGAEPELMEKLTRLKVERAQLQGRVEAARQAQAPIELHPAAIAEFVRTIERLQTALAGGDDNMADAAAIVRPYLYRIEVHPGEKRGEVKLLPVYSQGAVMNMALGLPADAPKYCIGGCGERI